MDNKIIEANRKFYISKFGLTTNELLNEVYELLSEKYNSGCTEKEPNKILCNPQLKQGVFW